MDGDSLKINPNTVNCFVIISLECLYILARSLSSTTPSINFIKGKIRSIAGLFLKFAILSSVFYNAALFYLSFKFEIDKVTLELTHVFNEKYFVKFQKYSLDLVSFMIISLKISEAFFISAVYLAISLICGVKVNSIGGPIDNFRMKICSFARIYGIFRLPIAFYSYFVENLFDEKLYLFFRLIFGSLEFFLISFFILLGKGNNPVKNINFSPAFLSFCCFSYGFLKFTINLIDFPFKLTQNYLEVIISIQFGLLCAIYLLITDIIFPRKIKKGLDETVNEAVNENMMENEVSLLETVIIFDEKKNLIKKE
jgi:hypothetical protein